MLKWYMTRMLSHTVMTIENGATIKLVGYETEW